MAELGGYDCEFVLEVPHDLKCPICQLTLREPVQLSGCGHRFCQKCIGVILGRRAPKCPVDRIAIKKSKVFQDVACKRQILDLQVKCANDQCSWQGELRGLEKHGKQCPFKIVFCTNGQCRHRVTREKLFQHSTQYCIWRPFICPHCSLKAPMITRREHMRACKRIPIWCLNGCQTKLPREEMNLHMMNDCPLTEVPCDYQYLGCQAKMQRKLGEKHKASAVHEHLDLACKRLNVAQKQIADLQEKANIVPFVWKIDNFSALVREMHSSNRSQREEGSVTLKSPCFHTRLQGHRFQMKVTLSQRPTEDAALVEISCAVLPGEYDEILEWESLQWIRLTVYSQGRSGSRNLMKTGAFVIHKPISDAGNLDSEVHSFKSPLTKLKEAYITSDVLYVGININKDRTALGEEQGEEQRGRDQEEREEVPERPDSDTRSCSSDDDYRGAARGSPSWREESSVSDAPSSPHSLDESVADSGPEAVERVDIIDSDSESAGYDGASMDDGQSDAGDTDDGGEHRVDGSDESDGDDFPSASGPGRMRSSASCGMQ